MACGAGARGPQNGIRPATGAFEFNIDGLAFREKFFTMRTTNFYVLFH